MAQHLLAVLMRGASDGLGRLAGEPAAEDRQPPECLLLGVA